MTRPLFPPLGQIERELFGAPDSFASEELVDPDRSPLGFAAAPSAHLLAMMERRVAADQAYPPAPLAVGQIRRITSVSQSGRQLGRSCAVLLGRAVGGRRWAGWLVAQESDWASERDMILQEEDGVLALDAAMVQAWNPVEVTLRGDEAILGKLSPRRLAAVSTLASHASTDAQWVAPRPGRIGAWDLDEHTTVVTGTPLGGDEDPRAAYQGLYRRLASELGIVAAPRPVRASWLDWLGAVFVRPVVTVGLAGLAVLQAGLLLFGGGAGPEPDVVFRNVTMAAPDDACRTKIRLMFKVDTPYADVVVALRRVDARLVGGPSETGDIWILPPLDQDPNEVAAMLRQSHLVERSEVVPTEERACKR